MIVLIDQGVEAAIVVGVGVGEYVWAGLVVVLGVLAGTWLQQRLRTETIGLLFALLLAGVAVDLIVS